MQNNLYYYSGARKSKVITDNITIIARFIIYFGFSLELGT